MDFWNNIVNTALLGTEKKQLAGSDLASGQDLATLWETVQLKEELDNEEKFLQIAALGLNYRKCGIMPLRKDDLPANAAPDETLPYCPPAAMTTLGEILNEELNSLLQLWLRQCISKSMIVNPEWIPPLLNKAAKVKAIREDVVRVCGKRGEWLAAMNREWNFPKPPAVESEWQDGTAEQRRNALREMRAADPAKGREMLLQTWPAENANTRAELMRQLEVNLSDDDKDWLETLLTDKSQKVKEEALRLLKLTPGSAVLQQYWEIIARAITLKKEKGFLGLTSKVVLQVDAPIVTSDAVFKSGIDQLSKDKKVTDGDYILQQLISETPPKRWETYFNATPEVIIGYFEGLPAARQFIESLMEAAIKFKDRNWAPRLVNHCSEVYAGAAALLSAAELEAYLLQHYSSDDDIREYVAKMDGEWSVALAKKVFEHVASHWYSYNNVFFKENIHLVPTSGLPDLNTFTPDPEKRTYYSANWQGNIEYIEKLMTIKRNVYKGFL